MIGPLALVDEMDGFRGDPQVLQIRLSLRLAAYWNLQIRTGPLGTIGSAADGGMSGMPAPANLFEKTTHFYPHEKPRCRVTGPMQNIPKRFPG